MISDPNGASFLIQGTTLGLALLSLFFSWRASRTGSPVYAIFGRWIRWLFIGFLGSSLVFFLSWTGYPFPVLLAVALLGWFLIETGYNWLAISALSKSELPLFPKFEESEHGDEWPSDAPFLQLLNWLRKTGFKKKQSLISFLGEQVLMRISVLETEDQLHRLQVLFLPNQRGAPFICLTFFATTRSGDYIVTDNLFLPFGGFYPENWLIERHPWMRSEEKLWRRHLARIDARAESLVPFVLTPIEQINEDQRMVEQLNRDLQFLNPIVEQIEHGRLSFAGKTRVWQEVWTLSYLGIPLRYN